STKDVYGLIEKLRDYLPKEGANEVGYPMLNVTRKEQGDYTAMVAIPVDKQMKGTSEIAPKQMLPNGFILTAIVKGGDDAIKKGLAAIANYITDYQKSVIAIPFESLITDRSKETDTTKWVTKIYYPVTNK